MLVRLRQTLREKLEKFNQISSASENLASQKELELRESMNNAIRMVVVNSTINFVFKLPLAIVPLHNAIATFYYKDQSLLKDENLGFHIYLSKLKLSGVFYFIPELADFLLTCLVSSQLFLFAKFDKKIRIGLERLLSWPGKKKSSEIRGEK